MYIELNGTYSTVIKHDEDSNWVEHKPDKIHLIEKPFGIRGCIKSNRTLLYKIHHRLDYNE